MSTATFRDDVVQVFQGLVTPLEAKDIEIGIYNATIDYAFMQHIPLTWNSDLFVEAYMALARSTFANLNNESYIKNNLLIERLKEGEFLPHEIPTMSRERMFPERWQKIQELEEKKMQSAYENIQTAMTDQITCGKCKKKKISYFELQTRKADEGATIYYRCISCGHRWKKS